MASTNTATTRESPSHSRTVKLITCDSTNLIYCVICPQCRKCYLEECKTSRARMNLHHNQSNFDIILAHPLKVNQHLKTCADGYFLVCPFQVVYTNHQITHEAYKRHFQKILHPTLHIKAQEKKKMLYLCEFLTENQELAYANSSAIMVACQQDLSLCRFTEELKEEEQPKETEWLTNTT